VLVGAENTVKLTGFEVARLGGADLNTGRLTEQADIQALGLLLMQMLAGAVRPRSEGAGPHPERTLGPEVPAAVRELMQILVRSPEPDMGSVANALWMELHGVTEPPNPTVPGSARAVWPWARWRTVGIGALVVVVIALGAWVTRYGATAPPPVPPVTQAVPAAPSLPAPAPRDPEPAAVGQSAEVVVSPPVPRTEPIPPKEPAVTPSPAAPESAEGTPRVRVTPAPRGVRTPPPETAERAEATSRVPGRPAPESGASRQESRPERETLDPSAIIDWLLKESPRQQR
jgi:hypothetical protein